MRSWSRACLAGVLGAPYATSDFSPGSVPLLTGDFEVFATDVMFAAYNGSLSLDRTSAPSPTAAATSRPF